MDAETRKTLEAIAATTEQMGALGLEQPPRDAAAIRAALAEVDRLKNRLVDEAERTNAAVTRSREHSARVSRLSSHLSAARAQVDALTQQVADLEARAIPKELLDTRRFEIELCWHPLVAGVVARYAKPMANGDWQVEWVSSPADAERVELFPTLSAALIAAKEAP